MYTTAPEVLIVLGAGASMHLGFPSGPELVSKLADSENGFHKLLQDYDDIAKWEHFQTKLARDKDQLKTIDEYLCQNQEFLELGVRAIAHEIYVCEQRIAEESLGWYGPFANVITNSNVRIPSLVVVTFNYDRLLEWGLHRSLIGKEYAERLYLIGQRIQINHIYGVIRKSAEQAKNADDPNLLIQATPQDICNASSQLRLIGQKTDFNPPGDAARYWSESIKVILFMGFGYHDSNLRFFEKAFCRKEVRLLGTALNLSNERKMMLAHRLPRLEFVKQNANDFFYKYALPLLNGSVPGTAAY